MSKSNIKKFYDSLICEFERLTKQFPNHDSQWIIDNLAIKKRLTLCEVDELKCRLLQKNITV